MSTLSTNTMKDSGVNIQIISTTDEFASLNADWNKVLVETGLENAFLTHEWLFCWWKNYGSGKNLIILKFTKDGQTIGFIPLMRYATKLTGLNLRVNGFLTNHWTRMNFILAHSIEECLRSFSRYIKESKQTFVIAQMNRSHQIYKHLVNILKEEGIAFIEQEKPHAFVELSGSWEEYFAGQSKNFRMDSRRKLKRLEAEGRVSLRRTKGENSKEILSQLKAVAQNCWQAEDEVNIVSTKEGFHFYQDICASALSGSLLDFTFLMVNEKPVAYMVGLINRGVYFAFDTAYDKDFERFSPGLILHNLLMEQLYAQKIKVFDFGYSASYKKRWSSQTRFVSDIIVFPKGIQGMLLKIGQKIKALRKKTNAKEEDHD